MIHGHPPSPHHAYFSERNSSSLEAIGSGWKASPFFRSLQQSRVLIGLPHSSSSILPMMWSLEATGFAILKAPDFCPLCFLISAGKPASSCWCSSLSLKNEPSKANNNQHTSDTLFSNLRLSTLSSVSQLSKLSEDSNGFTKCLATESHGSLSFQITASISLPPTARKQNAKLVSQILILIIPHRFP